MNDQQTHPEATRLEAFARGELELPEIDAVQQHLADCQTCCDALDSVPDDNLLALVRQTGTEVDADETMVVLQEPTDDAAPTSGQSGIADLPTELAGHSRYRVLELIGRGGMGDVYKAEHRMMQRTVALKVIKRELTQNPQAVERFEREVRAAASLTHGNIVAAYDAERANDSHFLAMEYVEGTDLAAVVRRRGQISAADACDYICQAANGLQHAHEQGMVHRDIKPHNLMLTAEGVVKILDFGLASLTESPFHAGETVVQKSDLTAVGTIMGTPDYISPEQATDARAADIRSDIYSLGATLFFLLAGRAPFDEGTVVEKLKSHAELDAERIDEIRADVPTEVADIIRRAMSKHRSDRFQTPSQLASALEPFAEKRQSDKSAKRTTGWSRLVMVALLLIFATPAVVLYVATNKGTLFINAHDENVDVVIRKNGKEVEIVDNLTGSRILRLPSGNYEIALKGQQNDLTLDRDSFELKRGSKTIVTVRRQEQRQASDSTTTRTSPPELPTPKNAVTNSVGIRLIPIAAGEFTMGSPPSEKERDRQEEQHTVKITAPFYMGMCEVTQQEYYRVMASNPNGFSASAKSKDRIQKQDASRFPIESVSWEDAAEFCRRLSERKSERDSGRVYRLPTEAEWEYACRAETKTAFFVGTKLDGATSNINDASAAPALQRPTHVGSYRPNAFGLYDMQGNVREWCGDWYEPDYYAESAESDPTGPSSSTVYGGSRVIRGGSWRLLANFARSANRHYGKPADRASDLGFRVVCEQRTDRGAAIAAIEAVGGEVKSRGDGTVVTVAFIGGRSEDAANLTDDQLVFLRGLSQLETLYLVGTKVTEVGLKEYVKDLTSLRNLYLTGVNMSDVGLGHLKEMADLRILYVDSPNVTDTGLENLRGMIKLSVLSLNDSQVTAAGLSNLKRMPYLSELRLNRTKVGDAGIEHLKELNHLSRLFLSGTEITDEGLKSLKGLTNMRQLYLSDTNVGDDGIEHLQGMTVLFRLELENTKVTDAGVERLQATLPNCRIAH